MLPSAEPSLPATPVGAYRQHGGDAQLVQASLSVGVVEGVVQHESRASHASQELPGGMGELHSRVARAHPSASVRFSTGSKGSLRTGVVKHRATCPCRREDGHLLPPPATGPRTRAPSSGGNHERGTGWRGARTIRQSPASARRKVPWSTGVPTAIPPRPSGRLSRCSNPDSASRPCHSQHVRVLAGKRLVTNNFYPGTTVPTPPCKPVSVPC